MCADGTYDAEALLVFPRGDDLREVVLAGCDDDAHVIVQKAVVADAAQAEPARRRHSRDIYAVVKQRQLVAGAGAAAAAKGVGRRRLCLRRTHCSTASLR